MKPFIIILLISCIDLILGCVGLVSAIYMSVWMYETENYDPALIFLATILGYGGIWFLATVIKRLTWIQMSHNFLVSVLLSVKIVVHIIYMYRTHRTAGNLKACQPRSTRGQWGEGTCTTPIVVKRHIKVSSASRVKLHVTIAYAVSATVGTIIPRWRWRFSYSVEREYEV